MRNKHELKIGYLIKLQNMRTNPNNLKIRGKKAKVVKINKKTIKISLIDNLEIFIFDRYKFNYEMLPVTKKRGRKPKTK